MGGIDSAKRFNVAIQRRVKRDLLVRCAVALGVVDDAVRGCEHVLPLGPHQHPRALGDLTAATAGHHKNLQFRPR